MISTKTWSSTVSGSGTCSGQSCAGLVCCGHCYPVLVTVNIMLNQCYFPLPYPVALRSQVVLHTVLSCCGIFPPMSHASMIHLWAIFCAISFFVQAQTTETGHSSKHSKHNMQKVSKGPRCGSSKRNMHEHKLNSRKHLRTQSEH
jgi:hypothetical protein